MISFSAESMAAEFLEIASEQRLNIIMKLKEKKSNISNMAKELQATAPEVHRNFSRLLKAGLIEKVDGNYHLTLYGKTIFTHFPSLTFMLQNKEFFKTHDFGDIPTKFIHRIGALGNSKIINGFVKVLGQDHALHLASAECLGLLRHHEPPASAMLARFSSQSSRVMRISRDFEPR